MPEILATVAPAIAYHLDRVKRKLASGTYATEPVDCFCGSTDGTVIREVDRYGLPHRMHFCARCGVLYASPRMTDAALAEFYKADYRSIYDDGITAEMRAEIIEERQKASNVLFELVCQYGELPRKVFEVGCHDGALLSAFLEEGIDCLGVDFSDGGIARGQAHGFPILPGGIEVLEQSGYQADLIILHHVLEHLPNLEPTLARLRALLTPDGLLYIGVPTLYTDRLPNLWQNAHLYQFTARTLAYVMECCGFQDVYLSEDIVSLWRPVEDFKPKSEVDSAEVYRIANFLNGKKNLMPIVRTINKFDRADRRRHIEAAIASGVPPLSPLINRHPKAEAIILGGGPSIGAEVERIRAVQREGAILFAIERMLPWCRSHGLMPDYVVAMDAHDDVAEGFQDAPDEPIYLLATQCHPSVYDCVRGKQAYLFATPQKDVPQGALMDAAQVPDWTEVNAGGSVTTCAMSLAMILGASRLHVFGFDCQCAEQRYASGIAGAGSQDDIITIDIDGYPDRVFTTTLPYLAFAQQFIKLVDLCRREGYLESATVYGDSLVRYLAKPQSALVMR